MKGAVFYNQLKSRLLIAVPYGWLLLFFFIPFLIVFKISFAESVIQIPPFTSLINFQDTVLTLKLNLFNYIDLYEYDLYLWAFLNSLKIAGVATFFTLLLGYPMAYAISQWPPHTRNLLLLLIILPSWTSFLIRIYAWIGILKPQGLINLFLIKLGVIDQPLTLLHTPIAVYIGIVYAYLPFMILPIYANLVKHDGRLLEASADLGAKPMTRFLHITLPLSYSGMIAGSLLVFIPAVGEFVIPTLLGGSETLMIGKLLWSEFFNARNWPGAASVAIALLITLILPMMLFHRTQSSNIENNQHG